jgi:hypothetical protein
VPFKIHKIRSATYKLEERREVNIFHKNREISILTIKKKTARLTLLQEATERTSQRGDTEQNKTRKTHSGMNESASLTPVQGPSTVACMIVT